MRKILQALLLLAVVLIAIQYVDFSSVWNVSAVYLAAVTLVALAANIARFYTLKLALLRRAIDLGWREWLSLGVYSSLLNLFLPLSAGLSIKAIYLKRKYRFRYADFIGTHSAITLLQVYFLVLVGGLSGLMSGKINDLATILIVALVLAAMSAPFFFAHERIRSESKLIQALLDIYTSFLVLAKDLRFVAEVLVNMGVILVFTCLAFYFSFGGLGVALGLPDAMLIAVAVSLLSLVNITPGNIGVQEFVVAFIGQALGGDFDSAFVAMLLIRAMSIVGFFLLMPAGMGLGLRRTGESV
ncbi:MAG: lysylphosphatidylglycerol synthase domain-containing protein [Pseudomonadota bacterium]